MSESKKKTQCTALFAELLRPMLQDYYDVQTNVRSVMCRVRLISCCCGEPAMRRRPSAACGAT